MVQILRRPRLLGKEGCRIAVGAGGAFLQDHRTLGGHVIFQKPQIAHPVRFQLHHQVKPVCRDALEIGGVVPRGEGIVIAALGLHDFRKFARRHVIRALEHQMLQKMRDARVSRWFIRRADAIPDHMDHNRGAMIFDHDNLQPVRQG